MRFLKTKIIIHKKMMIMTASSTIVMKILTIKGETKEKIKTKNIKKINKRSRMSHFGHMIINLIFLWKMFSLGFLLNKNTKKQCTQSENRLFYNLAASQQYNTGLSNQFTLHSSFLVKTVSM